jgi:uncharacterized protein YjfI (DUF2170 family)
MVDITKLANDLSNQGEDVESGFPFEVQPIPGDIEVLRITVEDREEFPIFVSTTQEQILCISYLFKENEVTESMLSEMNNAMLGTNISVPLSAFGKIGDQYIIYGSLSVNSSLSDVVHELEVLSGNTLEAIEAMSDFLK